MDLLSNQTFSKFFNLILRHTLQLKKANLPQKLFHIHYPFYTSFSIYHEAFLHFLLFPKTVKNNKTIF